MSGEFEFLVEVEDVDLVSTEDEGLVGVADSGLGRRCPAGGEDNADVD